MDNERTGEGLRAGGATVRGAARWRAAALRSAHADASCAVLWLGAVLWLSALWRCRVGRHVAGVRHACLPRAGHAAVWWTGRGGGCPFRATEWV